jgi:hypothetical protein
MITVNFDDIIIYPISCSFVSLFLTAKRQKYQIEKSDLETEICLIRQKNYGFVFADSKLRNLSATFLYKTFTP